MVAVRLPFASFRFSGTRGVWAFAPCYVSACAGNATCIHPLMKALVAFSASYRPAIAGCGQARSL
jgi:hypothetical protein